jgi:hypothetical protein
LMYGSMKRSNAVPAWLPLAARDMLAVT